MLEEKTIDPRLTKELVRLISENFEPCLPEETDDFKTTSDLLNEFSGFIITDVDTLTEAMQAAGFKLHYSGGGGFFWPMRPRL